jgi:hypothetical protein
MGRPVVWGAGGCLQNWDQGRGLMGREPGRAGILHATVELGPRGAQLGRHQWFPTEMGHSRDQEVGEPVGWGCSGPSQSWGLAGTEGQETQWGRDLVVLLFL